MTTESAPIVVPLDGSKNAENAVPFAALVARVYGAPVHFVYVADPEIVDTTKDYSAAKEAFASHVASLAERYGVARYVAHVAEGAAAATILRYALESEARMTVIASHGRGGFHATFIGSVADKVVRGARRPILVVPGVGSPVLPDERPILVALDGSSEAERGLGAARDLAKAVNAPVALMRAYSIPPPVGIEFSYYSPEVLASFQQAAEEYLQKVALKGEQAYAVQASAAIGIEETANQIDAGIVVMTSHGKGLAERVALGSTTDRVMHTIRRPLLIVPAED
jgi:nucleotide-binding universal stress UspA family protein